MHDGKDEGCTGVGTVCKAAAKLRTVAAGWKDAVDFALRTG